MQLLSVGSGRGGSNLHLVFTPEYRRDVFRDGEVKRTCLESFAQTRHGLGMRIQACGYGPDHARLFVPGCKSHSARYMVRRLKGASAHGVRHGLWDHVKDKLWGGSLWSDGYFYRSVGSATAEAVKCYIEHAQTEHRLQHDHETEPQEVGQARLTDF